jgi:beta-glucosidase
LSYTTFEYSKPKVSSKKFKDSEGLTVSVDVKNSGKVEGREIVQVYVRDVKSKLIRPLKELKGFAKVDLKPGETKTVAVKLDFRSFAYYHPGHKAWITENGEFQILIGASSKDIRFTETVELESTRVLPSILNRESTIRSWLEDPRGGPIFEPVYQQILAGMAAMFGAEKDEGADIGMDMTGFLMEMPLLSIFQFQEDALPAPAVDMVDMLLKTVHEAEAQ